MLKNIPFPGQGTSEEPEWVVWLTVLISLAIGWVIATSTMGRVTNFNGIAGGSIQVPATWVRTKADGALFTATNLQAGQYGARVSIRTVATADLKSTRDLTNTLTMAASNWSLVRSQDLEGFRILHIEPTNAVGRPAIALEYAYLTDPPVAGGAGNMPGLMHAIDTMVETKDGYAILTVAVEQNGSENLGDLNSRLLAGWQLP